MARKPVRNPAQYDVRKTTNVRLSPDVKEEAKAKSASLGKTLASYVEELIKKDCQIK